MCFSLPLILETSRSSGDPKYRSNKAILGGIVLGLNQHPIDYGMIKLRCWKIQSDVTRRLQVHLIDLRATELSFIHVVNVWVLVAVYIEMKSHETVINTENSWIS